MFCSLRNHKCEGCASGNCKSMRQICRGSGFTYVVVGKSASTSIRFAMNVKDEFVPFEEVCSLEGFVFSFVRNPFNRLYSCWNGWTKRETSPLYRIDSRIHFGIELKEFVKVVSTIPDDVSDEHFVSQSTLLAKPSGELIPDFVGKVESIAKDWEKVMEKTGLPSIGHHGKYSALPSYEYAYDEEMREMVLERYAEDFERWYNG